MVQSQTSYSILALTGLMDMIASLFCRVRERTVSSPQPPKIRFKLLHVVMHVATTTTGQLHQAWKGQGRLFFYLLTREGGIEWKS